MIAILILVASALFMLWAVGEVLTVPITTTPQELTPRQVKLWWGLALILVAELIYLVSYAYQI